MCDKCGCGLGGFSSRVYNKCPRCSSINIQKDTDPNDTDCLVCICKECELKWKEKD
jgi:hypothetical protein